MYKTIKKFFETILFIIVFILFILFTAYKAVNNEISKSNEIDYQLDIYDNGDHTIKLYNVRDNEITTILFDSLEETIKKQNE